MAVNIPSDVKQTIDRLPNLQKNLAYDLINTGKFDLSKSRDLAALQTAIYISKSETNFNYSSAYSSFGGSNNVMQGPWQFNTVYTGRLTKQQQLDRISKIVLGTSSTPSAKGTYNPDIAARYLANAKSADDVRRAILAGGLTPIDFQPLGEPTKWSNRLPTDFVLTTKQLDGPIPIQVEEWKDPATGTVSKKSNPIPVPDTEIENIYANLGDGELEDRIYELNEEVKVLNEKGSDLWTLEEQERYKEIKAELDQLYSVKTIRENQSCNSKQTPKGHSFPNTPDCEKFAKSVANGTAIQIYNKERTLPDPCGTSELAKINTALSNFFTAVKGLRKYADLYVNCAINKLSNITSLIRNTSQIIGAILKTLINRLRDFIIDSIIKGINAIIDSLLPTLAKTIKNTIVQRIVDEIFCRFKDIVQGLANLVTDFLFELVGKIVNVPFCIAEQFTNALVNNIAAIVDDAVGPLLDEINDVLSGITSVVSDVFQALDYIIGFEAFLCAKPNCPEIKKFKASPWGGPLQAQIDAFENFSPIPTASGIVGTVDDYISNIEIFGQRMGDAGEIDSDITNCDPSVYECGPPSIEIFGGGGIGAVGQVVVDNIGRTIGVDLISGGSGYTRPPFVSFIDNCEDTFTTGYAEINEQGEVTNIVMTSTPVAPPRDGRTENEPPSSIPTTEVENDYVVCLSGFRIKETGIGYTINDEIRIEPDIANLEASVKITESGQIIAIEIADNICGVPGRPEITINSPTGNGAVIDPVLSFVPVKDYDDGSGGTELVPGIINGGTGIDGAGTGIDGDGITNNIPDITFNSDFIIRAEIATNDREGLITTLRGRKIITEKQEFTRRDLIRIVDCIS